MEPADVRKLAAKVQIFYKKDSRSVNEPFRTLPAEYLANFSDRYRSAIWDDKEKLITLVGGDKAIYEQIFDWIMESANQDTVSAAQVPEVSHPSRPFTFLSLT